MTPIEELNSLVAHTATSSGFVEPSQAAKDFVAELIHKEKTLGLSSSEAVFLDKLMQVEHSMRLAKARERLPGNT